MNCSKQQKKELILNNNLRLIDFMLEKEIIVSPLFSQHVFAGLFLFILRSSYFCLKEFKTLKNRQQPSGNEETILLCGILIMNFKREIQVFYMYIYALHRVQLADLHRLESGSGVRTHSFLVKLGEDRKKYQEKTHTSINNTVQQAVASVEI